MRKAILGISGMVVVLAIAAYAASSSAPTVSADNALHTKGWGATPADCVLCHRAHRGSAEMLLTEDQEALCFSCHGNDASGSDLNVVAGGLEGGLDGALRGGGFGSARLDTDDPSGIGPTPGSGTPTPVKSILALAAVDAQPVQSEHSVDGSAQVVWGFGNIDATPAPGLAAYPLTCGKCHDPHGSGNYRILRTRPSDLVGSGTPTPVGMPNMAGKLLDEGPDPTPYNYTIADYWLVNYTDQWTRPGPTTGPGTPTPARTPASVETTGREVGKWCTTCHTRYWALGGTHSYETDSGDAIFAYKHTTTGEGRNASGNNVNPVTLSGSCIKCHVAHGTNAVVSGNATDVEWPDGVVESGANTDDSRLLKMNNRGVCQKCHNK